MKPRYEFFELLLFCFFFIYLLLHLLSQSNEFNSIISKFLCIFVLLYFLQFLLGVLIVCFFQFFALIFDSLSFISSVTEFKFCLSFFVFCMKHCKSLKLVQQALFTADELAEITVCSGRNTITTKFCDCGFVLIMLISFHFILFLKWTFSQEKVEYKMTSDLMKNISSNLHFVKITT